MTTPRKEDGRARVLPIGVEPEPEPPSPATRPSRIHGIAIAGMAMSALVGIVAMFLFVSVGWPDDSGRYVIAIFFLSAIVFIACASAAVFTAARDTYAVNPRTPGEPPDKPLDDRTAGLD